jgi:hypothetical protein
VTISKGNPVPSVEKPAPEEPQAEEEESPAPYHIPGPPSREDIIRQRAKLEWIDEFSPKDWVHQWEGEPDVEFVIRKAKDRRKWIGRITKILENGSSKKMVRYAFYVDLIAGGRKPREIRDKAELAVWRK